MNAKEQTNGLKQTELGTLPEDWEVVRLGEVADISSGGSAPQGEGYFSCRNPFIRVQHIERKNDRIVKWDLITDDAVKDYNLKLYPKGTIVFPKSGASIYLEKRARLPIDAYIVSHLCAVISNNDKVNQDFLFHGLKNIELSKDKADGYPTLNLSEVKNVKIPLPPFPEQKKIAAVLSAVQEAKEKTEQVINATKELKKSLMKHLFTYGAVSVQEAENVPLKETEIGLIPEHWEVVRLGEVFKLTSGKTRPKNLKQIKYGEFLYPVYGGNGIMGYSDKYLINYTTIILGRVGEYCGSVHISKNKSWVSDNALYAKEFLYEDFDIYFLAASIKMLDLNRLKNIGGQPLISQSIVYSQSIPLPPLPEQQKIASILSAVDEKIQAEENKKKALEDLFKTLLHNLMTAKIRVNLLEIPV